MGTNIDLPMYMKALNTQYKLLGVYQYPWLRRIGKKYREEKVFPNSPIMIASYYADALDKEIALLFSIGIKNAEEDLYKAILTAKELLGDSPLATLKSRLFIHWHKSTNNTFEMKSILRYERIMSILYKIYEDEDWNSIKELVLSYCMPINSALGVVLTGIPSDNREIRLLEVAMMLTSNNGFGENIWQMEEESYYNFPNDPLVRKFAGTFYPPYVGYGEEVTEEDLIDFLDFTSYEDFFFAYLAYDKLMREKAEEMKYPMDEWIRYTRGIKSRSWDKQMRMNLNGRYAQRKLKMIIPPDTW